MQARLRPRGPRIAAWCALIVPACLCVFVTCAAATGIGSLRPARVIFEPIATRGALSALRGGADDAKDEGVRYQRKLQRSYSQNSVMPVADHPTNILASTSSFDRKGEKRLDLQMVTSRLENTIEVVVRSRYGGNIIKEGTSDLVMHWGVQQEEDPANVDIEQVRPLRIYPTAEMSLQWHLAPKRLPAACTTRRSRGHASAKKMWRV